MSVLWLNFRDENGADRRVPVSGDSFTIGRQPDNDLAIADTRLSRTHLKIDRFGSVFVASDCGSSNGSTHNGSPIDKPVSLANGDRLVLGGGPEILVEIIQEAAEPRRERRSKQTAVDESEGFSAIPTVAFIVAPLIVVMLLVCGGGVLYFAGGSNRKEVVTVDPKFPDSSPRPTAEDDEPENSPSPTPSVVPTAGIDSPQPDGTAPPPNESRSIEENSAKFLRRIALNDPNAFLATEQVAIVKEKISTFRGSSAIAGNLRAVKSNSSQFESLASANGFKPQFLAAAALTKIGNKTGDPVATLKTMMPFLNDLRISLGNSLADDNLLIMADYTRREKNSGRSLQSILEGIPRSKIGGADPREIRTIWFLRKNDKISAEMYEFAVRFLAIGTIMQNPGEFGVNSEPVTF